MSKRFDNEKKGVLFRNAEKQSDKHPDYSGSATIEGVEYFLDAWINEAESGRKYMSLRFKAKTGGGQEPKRQAQQKRQRSADYDDNWG